MKKSRIPIAAILLPMVSILIFCACADTPAVPTPESASGAYVNTGFEYYRWEEGLRLMIWIEGIQSSSCDVLTGEQEVSIDCYAITNTNTRFEWRLITQDGKDAEFSIDSQSFDLAEGNVFILASSDEEASVSQLNARPL